MATLRRLSHANNGRQRHIRTYIIQLTHEAEGKNILRFELDRQDVCGDGEGWLQRRHNGVSKGKCGIMISSIICSLQCSLNAAIRQHRSGGVSKDGRAKRQRQEGGAIEKKKQDMGGVCAVSFQLACFMTSSIRSQSMALRSSHRDESSSSSGIVKGSVFHRIFPNGAMGVSPSLGGPGGGGRNGRGRTRSGARYDAVPDPSNGGVYTRGDGANRGVGDAEDGRCGSVGGSITLGRCGRADDDVGGGDRRDTGVVCRGDHAGGGDLGRCGGAVEGRGSRERSEVSIGGGGCDFGIFGRGRDLPKELEVGLIRKEKGSDRDQGIATDRRWSDCRSLSK